MDSMKLEMKRFDFDTIDKYLAWRELHANDIFQPGEIIFIEVRDIDARFIKIGKENKVFIDLPVNVLNFPYSWNYWIGEYLCPICGTQFPEDIDPEYMNYCPYCGERLHKQNEII